MFNIIKYYFEYCWFKYEYKNDNNKIAIQSKRDF